MKVRRKKRPKSRYERGEYPAKGTPEWDELTDEEKRLSNLAPTWKKGQSGNPLGRKAGTGSVVHYLKKMIAEPSHKKRYETVAHELASVSIRQAKKGQIDFMRMIVDKTEKNELTRNDLTELIDRVFDIVGQYVSDQEALANIAQAFASLKLLEE